ncbi:MULTISPECIES: beta-ketoacyl synthase N-terminal-like domain-containing protein [unclassified Streptomyces]|uniref:beta-ketoacyl synthase N-terminal-like domain-containing protein n=1 Tax=unclassified Streptomyces TaxID=2593676 RepID=UPI001BEB4BB7|nr:MULTISPECIES: beta-ketoacyl synthase N-terminal-like domain-containing protein [unclassified Streptomyces]MBT2405493.1 3-oxoacyl-ACP synthase [Streptomyces sp. ISL-21]MBT2454411.1 3-oxoacyl-ACP synthase [Streptomyces sp. ISL-86]MBT2607828.1 3-oxoacyl-ACP synthase [Streptomyces sp. ISL-87]
MSPTPLVISGWSAVSPFGVGSDSFRTGIAAGRTTVATMDPEAFPGPFAEGAVVPDFSAAKYVGKKGTRTMDRVTALAVTAVGGLVEVFREELTARPEQTGLVLGTGSGSVQSIMDFTRDALAGERPYHVDPARFPNTVMNRAAGQSAIWHGIKGPNTTVAGGSLTGLLAIGYALRLHRGGHCSRVLVGAAEEYSAQRAWLEWHGRTDEERDTPLGEGSAVFLLETAQDAAAAGRDPLARIGATAFRAFHEPEGAREALAVCVRGALERSGVAAADVRLVAPLGAGGPLVAQEEAAITDALGVAATPDWIRIRPLIGDTSAASAALQLAGVLAAADAHGLAPGEAALVTAIERDGLVGCAILTGD